MYSSIYNSHAVHMGAFVYIEICTKSKIFKHEISDPMQHLMHTNSTVKIKINR